MKAEKSCINCDIPFTDGYYISGGCAKKCKTDQLENWKKLKHIHIKPFFRWYDIWIGFYIDKNNKTLYFCPLPMIRLKVSLI